MPKPLVLLVADVPCAGPLERGRASSFDADKPTPSEINNLEDWLRLAGYETQTASVSEFATAITPPHSVVFPLWRGGPSRNRTGIVPAICEERGLKYIGGDAFTHIVCQDKSLTKCLAHQAGFRTPAEVVLTNIDNFHKLRPSSTLNFPVVVKPLHNGCSIGVDEASLCPSDLEAQARTIELHKSNLWPVVWEEFIEGDEVSICLIEERGKIVLSSVAMYVNSEGACPFRQKLFTHADKVYPDGRWKIVHRADLNLEHVYDSVELLLERLGKIDMLRVDGRVCGEEFILNELTPDIHMGLDSAYLGGFLSKGLKPETVLDTAISASLTNQT